MDSKAKVGDNVESGREDVGSTLDAPHQSTYQEVDVAPTKSTKSPAFQFYPRDFLSSRKVDRMSMTERGIYITLLAHCWIDRGLPTDLSELAAACRMKPAQFERIWSRGVVSQCFEFRNDRLVNPRLEVERKVQVEYSRKQREKAEKRWIADAGALPVSSSGNAPIPSHPIPSHSIPKGKKESAEPQSDSTPVVMTFPVVGDPEHPEWELRQARIDRLIEAYPNLDVQAQCRKARVWAQENPTKRKTAKGMPAFLFKWMDNATNRGGPRPALAATGTEGRGRTGVVKGQFEGLEEHD